MKKTNAMRLLDSRQIPYETKSYEVDLEDLSAETVARKIAIEPGRLLKTLVVRGSKGCCFAIIPTDTELDLKALAKAANDKKMDLVNVREVLGLTGYVRGGVTVLGAKKAFPVFFDIRALGYEQVSISAGVRGQQIQLSPRLYVEIIGAHIAEIARDAVRA